MPSLTEIDEFVKGHGEEGVRLLVLFRLLKSTVKPKLKQMYPSFDFDEADLDQILMDEAYKLVKIGANKLTDKDIKELLLKLNRQRMESSRMLNSTDLKPKTHD